MKELLIITDIRYLGLQHTSLLNTGISDAHHLHIQNILLVLMPIYLWSFRNYFWGINRTDSFMDNYNVKEFTF